MPSPSSDLDEHGESAGASGLDRYRWLFAPRWMVLHVLVFAAVCGMVAAGFWQYSRLQSRRASNALIIARAENPPVPVEDVLAPTATDADVAAATFRRVTVTGEYVVDDQVLIRNRSNRSAPGYYVVTPMALPDGTAVAVNRGWIPLLLGDAPTAGAYAPPTGTVTVTGLVLGTQRQEGLGVVDPAEGRLSTLSRIDVGRLGAQMTMPLYPMQVQLVSQEPAQPTSNGTSIPDPVEQPVLDDGPHVNYMGQWFIFATMTCIVYPLLMRRTARNKANEAARALADAAAGGPFADDGDREQVGDGHAGDVAVSGREPRPASALSSGPR